MLGIPGFSHARAPLSNYAATTNPGVGDDAADGYRVGSLWYNVTLDLAWYCIDASAGAAIWRLVDPIKVLDQSAVAAPHTGNTDETILATVVIPANSMGLNGRVRIESQWSVNNDGSVKTPRIRFGGIGGTAYSPTAMTSLLTGRFLGTIMNRNAQNSQLGWVSGTGAGGIATSTSGFQTSAKATNVDVDLVFTGQLADGADTITLESYIVELIWKA